MKREVGLFDRYFESEIDRPQQAFGLKGEGEGGVQRWDQVSVLGNKMGDGAFYWYGEYYTRTIL